MFMIQVECSLKSSGDIQSKISDSFLRYFLANRDLFITHPSFGFTRGDSYPDYTTIYRATLYMRNNRSIEADWRFNGHTANIHIDMFNSDLDKATIECLVLPLCLNLKSIGNVKYLDLTNEDSSWVELK